MGAILQRSVRFGARPRGIVVILVNGRILLDALIAVIYAVARLSFDGTVHHRPKIPRPEQILTAAE
jgi:hypothetical protein